MSLVENELNITETHCRWCFQETDPGADSQQNTTKPVADSSYGGFAAAWAHSLSDPCLPLNKTESPNSTKFHLVTSLIQVLMLCFPVYRITAACVFKAWHSFSGWISPWKILDYVTLNVNDSHVQYPAWMMQWSLLIFENIVSSSTLETVKSEDEWRPAMRAGLKILNMVELPFTRAVGLSLSLPCYFSGISWIRYAEKVALEVKMQLSLSPVAVC